jgi:hypothetical protein
METPPVHTDSHFPTFHRCRLFIFSRRSVYALIVLITLIALFYAEENFRGKIAWDHYRKEAEARGVRFDFASFIPAPVPDDQNAVAIPLVRSWFQRPQPDDPDWAALTLVTKAESRVSSRKIRPDRRSTERFTDLVAIQESLAQLQSGKKDRNVSVVDQDRTPKERAEAAAAVLEYLKGYQFAFDQFRAASKRPYARYPITYKLDDPFSILLPHLAKIKSLVQALRVQTEAELAVGRVDDAFNDVMLMLWLTDSMRDEPFLIDQLVRNACLQITMLPLWQGLAEHKWTDAQLQKLQERFGQFDFITDMQGPAASERAASVSLIERLARHPLSRPGFNELFDNPRSSPSPAMLMPRGWLYFEALNYCTWMDEQMKDGFDLQKRTVNPRQLEENNARMTRALTNTGPALFFSHRFFAKVLLPELKNATRRFALGQVTADEAALACALERYRLAHGKLPEALGALVPKFISKLPHDVLTGGPLKYERVNDSDFVLSSVGWAASSSDSRFPSEIRISSDRPGEWVWRSAP